MTAYSNADGTTIDVPDELIAAMGPGWSKVGGGSKSQPAPKPDLESETADEPDSDGTPPPRSGKGSSDANWTVYARSQGVKVTDEMTRKEVIAACEDAGVPVS